MPKTLNELAAAYLRENGIKIAFLADFLNVDHSILSKWLRGKYNLNQESIIKIHEFLRESHKTVDKILNEKE